MHARQAFALVCLLSLGGCGLPMPIVLASYVADAVSFVATGKSVGDHGISYAADEDCALFRVVRGEAVCRPYEGPREPLFDLAAAGDAAWPPEGIRPDPTGPIPAPPAAAVRVAGPAVGAPAGAAETTWLLVLGSFAERARAERLSDSMAAHGARVLPGQASGRPVFRVAVGPFAPATLDDARARMRAFGFADAWALAPAALLAAAPRSAPTPGSG